MNTNQLLEKYGKSRKGRRGRRKPKKRVVHSEIMELPERIKVGIAVYDVLGYVKEDHGKTNYKKVRLRIADGTSRVGLETVKDWPIADIYPSLTTYFECKK